MVVLKRAREVVWSWAVWKVGKSIAGRDVLLRCLGLVYLKGWVSITRKSSRRVIARTRLRSHC